MIVTNARSKRPRGNECTVALDVAMRGGILKGRVAITAGAALIGKSVLELLTAAASRECLLATKDTPDRAISLFFISFALLPSVPPLFLLTPLWPSLFFFPPSFLKI